MCKDKWKFSIIPRSEEIIFSPLLEYFNKIGLDGLVRENVQNSLDGRDKNLKREVEVRIDIGNIEKSRLPGIHEIENHIMALKGHNKYIENNIEHMKKAIRKNNISYLTFEDLNTKGLSGASNGANYGEGDTFGIYAYKKGVHNIYSDSYFESLRGGSHGVGKIASNAASDVNLMYFANCDEDCQMHLGGSVQLVEHEYNKKFYRSTGYFTDEVDGVYYPYRNNILDKVFKKETRGLKIIIPFLKDEYNDKSAIIRSVCDNFFIAIIEKKLIVDVCGQKIDSGSIFDIINNKKIYGEDEINENKNFTKLYIETYKNSPKEIISIEDRNGNNYRFNLYFQYNEDIKKGRLGIVRSIGMKIEDFKIKSHARTCFNAIFLPDSSKEDVFLKSLEDKSHTKISCDHIKNEDDRKNAKRFINEIHRRMAEYIESKIREYNPVDGEIDTEDLIYIIENSFRKRPTKDRQVVEISKGNKNKKITKTKGSKGKGYDKRNSHGKPSNSTGATRNGRKTLVKSPDGKEKKEKVSYEVNSDVIGRVVCNNNEYIEIDFSREKLVRAEKKCDVYIKIIDGDGKESSDKIKINEMYNSIVDMNTNENINLSDNDCIAGAYINADKKVKLKMNLNNKVNRFLKYKYFVEV